MPDNRLAKQEVKRLNRQQDRDLAHYEMRPRDPYEILGIKKKEKEEQKDD